MDSVQSETQRQEADRVAAELRAAAATPSQTNLAVGKRSATFGDNSSSSNKQQRNGSPPGRHGRPGMNDTDSADELRKGTLVTLAGAWTALILTTTCSNRR